ncbi:MAG TPA: 3-phosphoshikimate 1-carboxyvinyltransferase [Candidatus Limnocylindrales bacterium]|nr:3-phosphoshikimate 1-carboxyvinyltransferase [Candidatus Limnocylindrales bacterium]
MTTGNVPARAPVGGSAADQAMVVRPAGRLRGTPALPGDKSISHRALLLALLAEGESTIAAAGDGEDVRTTAAIIAALGAGVERTGVGGGRVDYRVVSPGGAALTEPEGVLDCGNSGTTTRLLAGLLAGRDLFAVLDGDASLRRRPMGRVTEPLTRMGAAFAGRGGGTLLPLAITGRRVLTAIRYDTPVPSAQVKSAVLLAGLAADGETAVTESVATRDHTERMLRARGIAVEETTGPDGAHTVRLDGPVLPAAIRETVPADPSGAAFWLVAGAAHPDAELRLEGVSTNPTRRAIIDILRRMGASIEEHDRPAPGGADGEPLADLVVRSSDLRGVDLSPADVAAAIDEIPVLALAAATAAGTTRFRGAGELRHKESDRIAGIAAGLTALGARVRVEGDDIEIQGGAPLRGAVTETHDDHRLAMTFAIAGLIAGGETVIDRPGSAAISYPGFFHQLEGVRA